MRFLFPYFAMACLVLSCGISAPARASHVYEGVDLRSENLTNASATTMRRDDPLKKATVLVFLSSKCPCSISHMGEIKSLAETFQDFRFIGVNSNLDETLENAGAFFKAQSLKFPILRDQNSRMADEFKALKTPHAFVFSNDGKILFQGGVSNSSKFERADRKFLREALEDIAQKRAVRSPLARALGCAIQRNN